LRHEALGLLTDAASREELTAIVGGYAMISSAIRT
jgi:hypothetical protein